VPLPTSRLRTLNDAPPNAQGRFVIYWMTMSRRLHHNFALDHAIDRAAEWRLPLLVLETLRVDYPYASDRLHRFLLQGMHDNALAAQSLPLRYAAYVEPRHGHGRGLIEALASEAALIVTDDSPSFFIPHMLASVAPRLPVPLEAVDDYGLLPIRSVGKACPTAFVFRRLSQKRLPPLLLERPRAEPLFGRSLPQLPSLPRALTERWPALSLHELGRLTDALETLPIDHHIPPVALTGGAQAAQMRLAEFLAHGLDRYQDDRNHPDRQGTSGLSPYLHFGHIGIHQIAHTILAREGWSPDRLALNPRGAREGYWGVSANAEAFLDQLVTWRELGANTLTFLPHAEHFDTLPSWARASLLKHAQDPRPYTYDLATLDAGLTHDRVWNAAQHELVTTGLMHNYLRMLWGKRILEWSATPQQALTTMLALNDRYALDGRDPNSLAGITWCLGRYDRPWAPERPIFGVVRYMSSANTLKKLRMRRYLEAHSAPTGQRTLF